jgi:hypothetical protein
VDLWQRLTHRADDDRPVPRAAPMRRDPDLDAMHMEQHRLIHESGYAAERVRDSWNERVRRSWNPDAR